LQPSTEPDGDLKLEIGHVLLVDVVGYSKLLVNEQIELLQLLNRIVREAPQFRSAEAAGKLMRLPTGDGMALLFFESPEAPVECALQISAAAREHPHLQLRMGVHSGPIKEVMDVNDRANFAGAGINLAQRVLDCGDAGHILVSKRVAEDLSSYRRWHPYLSDLGECEVKHGLRIHLFNVCKDGLGNPALPERVQKHKQQRQTAAADVPETPEKRRSRLIKTAAWSVGALAVMGLLIALVLTFVGQVRSAPRDLSIAVLPFANDSAVETSKSFADGVQEDIRTYLSRINGLKVISRMSSMQYRADVPRALPQIAKELGVSYVLEGSVRRDGDRVRVSAQLIDATTDAQVWGENYDRDVTNALAIQTDIAREIAGQLRLRLSAQEKAAIRKRLTDNEEAHDLYVEAKNAIDAAIFSGSARDSLTRAADMLGRAVTLDPNFFLAYYELAHVHDQFYLRFDPTPARLAAAEAAIRHLERLDPTAGETHLARARHRYWGYHDYDAARAELALADRALPNDPTVPLLIGYLDRRQGRWEQSTHNLQRALELDPKNRFILQQIALTYFNQRRFREMAQVLDRAVLLSGGHIIPRAQRAAVDVDWRADTTRLHAVVDSALAEDPAGAVEIADHRIDLALYERDAGAAARAIADAGGGACQTEALPFPVSWCEAMAARLRADEEAAQRAFAKAREEMAALVQQAPNNAGALAVLALCDAMLGNKDAAIREGRRAVELLPISKDALNGPLLVGYLAVIYAWTGEKDLAMEQLEIATKVPSYWSYGNLKLHPLWDPLRDDERFARLLERLAPKE
jgi:TolB-like protein/Tfp pilus assembly protein PilF